MRTLLYIPLLIAAGLYVLYMNVKSNVSARVTGVKKDGSKFGVNVMFSNHSLIPIHLTNVKARVFTGQGKPVTSANTAELSIKKGESEKVTFLLSGFMPDANTSKLTDLLKLKDYYVIVSFRIFGLKIVSGKHYISDELEGMI